MATRAAGRVDVQAQQRAVAGGRELDAQQFEPQGLDRGCEQFADFSRLAGHSVRSMPLRLRNFENKKGP